MIGGGNDSFMGEIHRKAIEQTGCLELVCGAFGSTRNSSYETGKKLGLPTRRVYGTYRELFRREHSLPKADRMDFVTIVTPNAMHYPISMSALDTHFPIFTEKPFTCNLDEALNLVRKQRMNEIPYGICMVYPNYPMLQTARGLIQKKNELGIIRKVVISYELGWMSPRLETAGNHQAGWRTDPRRCGAAGCLADLGSHCFYIAEWLTGLSVKEVCADLYPGVPGRILDDDCTMMVRFSNGIHGVFLTSQIDTGSASGLCCKIIGDQASLVWKQSTPSLLVLTAQDGTVTTYGNATPCLENGSILCPATPYGNNEAYIQALTETYRSFAEYLQKKDKATKNFMTVEEGLRSVVFVDAALKNGTEPPETEISDEEQANIQPKWEPVVVPEIQEL